MRTIFMGTPQFSVPILEALADAGHDIIGVVTQPDKPKDRGKAVKMSPVKERALDLEIPVYQPVRVKDPEFLSLLEDIAPDIIVVAAFGQILPQRLLDIPPYGCINVHASLLPSYRGAAPVQWAVINGEEISGVTTMYMNAGLDTGDILEQAQLKLDPDETGDSLNIRLSVLGAELIRSTLDKIEQGTIVRTPQPEKSPTDYARMLDRSMSDIDWTMDALRIERLVRGLYSWPGTYSRYDGRILKISKAKAYERDLKGECGEVVLSDKNTLLVKTGKGCLSLLEVQPEGKKRMSIDAFLRGYPVKEHMKFERS